MTTTESFWNFSDRIYRCEGIPDACLALQNEYGADVNVLLFCCWMGATRGEIKAGSFDSVLGFSRSWADHVVRRLRHARTWMKTEGCPDPGVPEESFTNLRERIKTVEFEAEQLQENVMQSIVKTIPVAHSNRDERVNAALQYLHRYCALENFEWDSGAQLHLDVILRVAIPHATKIKHTE